MAPTSDEIEKDGGKCEKVATDFWICTDKDGKVWWCSNSGKDCIPDPFGWSRKPPWRFIGTLVSHKVFGRR